jgi:hypothetical protein
MERSEIRERSISLNADPDFIRATKKKKEAERRKTLFRNHRNSRCGTHLTGAHDFRRSTTALTEGSRRP